MRFPLRPFLFAAATFTLPCHARDPEPATPLRDKTLVLWAAPANLTQRGGSALTLDDGTDHFDGIIFGEISPAKWMAGSDFFRRTLRDQSAVLAETADLKTFVQIAITYAGKDITLYRNGLPYSRYTAAGPLQDFGPLRGTVIFGRRHYVQTDNARFAGAIDDARIYDRALTPAEIAALRPNTPSAEKPWAWWTFENGDARELTGRFPISELTGGAKIKDGSLLLDGTDGELISRMPFLPETPARPSPAPENWLTFHLAHPGPGEAEPGDPNCAFFWKGRYHLHYIYKNQDGHAFAHVSSADLVHWQWHPTTLTPAKTRHGMYSGTGFLTKEGQPAIIYHGEGSGKNQISIAAEKDNDALEKWSPPWPVEPKISPGQDATKIANWDPDAWLDGDHYYALSGGSPGSGKPPTLFKSTDLRNWDYLGLFLDHDMPGVRPDEDISCPNFFQIGNKHMLLCISHTLGCRYYLGTWKNTKNEKFTPDFHARMNWNKWDFFAPESVLTPDGRRVMWAWCRLMFPQTGIQSLPRELSLPEDGILRIKPLRELETLRHDEHHITDLTAIPDQPVILPGIQGDALELNLLLHPGTARQFGLELYADEKGRGGLPILIDRDKGTLAIGTTTIAPFQLGDREPLQLRVFIDKNMIEVFANDRQSLVASHRPAPGQTTTSLFTRSGDLLLKQATSWRMHSIYPEK